MKTGRIRLLFYRDGGGTKMDRVPDGQAAILGKNIVLRDHSVPVRTALRQDCKEKGGTVMEWYIS